MLLPLLPVTPTVRGGVVGHPERGAAGDRAPRGRAARPSTGGSAAPPASGPPRRRRPARRTPGRRRPAAPASASAPSHGTRQEVRAVVDREQAARAVRGDGGDRRPTLPAGPPDGDGRPRRSARRTDLLRLGGRRTRRTSMASCPQRAATAGGRRSTFPVVLVRPRPPAWPVRLRAHRPGRRLRFTEMITSRCRREPPSAGRAGALTGCWTCCTWSPGSATTRPPRRRG